MSIKKLTPVLLVPAIEPALDFWARVGFSKTMEVPDADAPHGNVLAFVVLSNGTLELMYQTYSSVEKDMPSALAGIQRGPTFLYLEVDSIEATLAAMKGVPLTMEMRTAFYGAKEFGVADPAGHRITFAEFPAA